MNLSLKTFKRLVTFLVIAWSIVALTGCGQDNKEREQTRITVDKKSGELRFVGGIKCIECHQQEYDLWKGSDHDLAMQEVSDSTVLGDFNNRTFSYYGIISKFFIKDKKFFVNTEGPDGELHDYEIKYVFGIRPLQQYLVEFPGGKYQILPLCWNTRPAEQGGQRWFHIYPQERITASDELFWTGMNQNWNYMCAECHSTHLQKNYDMEKEVYHTTWSEINVSCEACHGPGSKHLEWVKLSKQRARTDEYTNMGLQVRLSDPAKGTWVFDKNSPTAHRTTLLQSKMQIETCARCHSRRALLTEDYQYGKPIMDTHRIQLLNENYYFADGQIRDEVYVYGSFLQSKMYRKGVVCSNCHEPHSGKIFTAGNALCYRCHLYETYGTRQHHFHNPDSSGASCVECHMPERTYMVVDPRRDHSIRIPRPDLSMVLETPNACNKCHTEKSVEWAAKYTKKWYGKRAHEKPHYGKVINAGRRHLPFADIDLMAASADTSLPAIVRATTLSMLADYSNPSIASIIKNALRDANPLLRMGAAEALVVFEPADRFALAGHLLRDPVRSVRMAAVSHLLDVPQSSMSITERSLMNKVINEYINVQNENGERASSQLNLATVYIRQGYQDKAEAEYRTAIRLEPYFVYSYINLADLYRGQGREKEAENLLRKAISSYPGSADLHYALGLLLVRKRQTVEVLAELKQAMEIRPDDLHLQYVYAIALNSSGKSDQAIQILRTILVQEPAKEDARLALTTIYRDKGDRSQAIESAKKLTVYWPYNNRYEQLLKDLQTSR